MRRFPVTIFIVIVAIVAAVGGWMLFAKSEHDRYVAVQRVRNSYSEFHLRYEIAHDDGSISREVWTMANVNGVSSASYAVTDRKGTTATFDEPIPGYDVTFLFDKLVQDGIWELHSRSGKGVSHEVYTVEIAQTADTKKGSHHFQFTNPHYLATTAGREYHIHLDPKKPVPNLLMLDSTATADPRYQKIVDDFESFGSPGFKKTIVAAREKVLKS